MFRTKRKIERDLVAALIEVNQLKLRAASLENENKHLQNLLNTQFAGQQTEFTKQIESANAKADLWKEFYLEQKSGVPFSSLEIQIFDNTF